MVDRDKKQLLKYVLGGLIVTGAFAIMAPGLINYVSGMLRLVSLIATIVAAAFLIVFVYHRFKPKKVEPQEESTNEDQ
ncbi:MAG: hypothetical protein K2X93_22180 [Candidatus Obscuribacterales bacterium]|nr:hypothetical protein [Candidatus Obscuribacterales bacterium]